MEFKSKYSGEQIEGLLDLVSEGGGSSSGGGVVYYGINSDVVDSSMVKDLLLASGHFILNCRCQTGTTAMINAGTAYGCENPSQVIAIIVTTGPVKKITKYGSTVYESEKKYTEDAIFQMIMAQGGFIEITQDDYYTF